MGEILTANISGIADEDGLDNVTFTYQWMADNADIEGATDSTYEVSDDDVGKTIQVKVSFTDDRNNGESLTSAATAAVAAKPNSPATGQPTISGTVQVGETLTVDTTDIADADGLTDATFAYQWLTDDVNVEGAANPTYTLADGDEGKAIKVRVSFTDDADNQETLTSAATAAVAARPNSPATGQPTISGTVQVGETLTVDTTDIADADGLTDAVFSYQWLADDVNIDGATDSTYILADRDESKAIKVQVSFTDDAGNEETLTSGATAAVEYVDGPPGAPRDVKVEAGDTKLQVSWQPPADENKAPVEQYQIQYREEGGSNQELHTTRLSQQITDLTNGVTYEVQVTAKNAAGYGTPSDEMSDTPQAGTAAKPDTPQQFTGEAVYHRRVALDWDGVADADSYEVQFYDWDSGELVVLPFKRRLRRVQRIERGGGRPA